MHSSLLLATIQAAALTVAPGPNDNCPNSSQVLAALEAHAPSLVTPRLDDDPARLLTLTLMPAQASGDSSFSLVDSAGLVKLYRSLPASLGDRVRDCAALADTVAFIVIRYFEEVELPALPERKPPPPPPPTPPLAPSPEPPAAPPVKASKKIGAATTPPDSPIAELAKLSLYAEGGRRYPGAAEDFGGYQAKLGLGVLLAPFAQRKADLWLDVSGGFAGNGTVDVKGGPTGTSNRWSGELALLAGWRYVASRLYAGPTADLDLIWISTEAQGHPPQHEHRFAAAAGIKIGYQRFWAGRFFARADCTGAIALMKERVVLKSSGVAMFSTPRMYATLALGLGVWF